MLKNIVAAALVAFSASGVSAGFNSWSVEVEDDPFDNKGRMVLMNSDSLKTGLLIICEQETDGIFVRWASPYPYDQSSPPPEIPYKFALAFDTGQRHDALAVAGRLGTGGIGFDAPFIGEEAKAILRSFAAARSKIFIRIGEADPVSFSARGSTNAANRALAYCFEG